MKTPLKILHIGKYFSPFNGGVEQVTQSLAEQTSAAGNEVRVLAHQHEPFKRTTQRQFPASYTVIQTFIIAVLMYTPIAPLFFVHLWRELKRCPDIIHIHMPNPSALWLLLLPAGRRAKWLIHWHSDVLDEHASLALRVFYKFYRPFEYWMLKRANVIVCTSPNYAKHSMALKKFMNKVRVVPLGVDVNGIELSPDHRKARQQNEIKILTVGRLTYYKGHRYMLEALALLKQRDMTPKWHIVGTGEEQSRLEKLASTLNLNSQVKFCGRLSDSELKNQFKDCDIFCLPSIERTEAFGIVLLEAMRASLPCITTDVPGSGMNYVVKHNKTGLIAARADPQSLAGALEQAISNAEYRLELGKMGNQRLLQYFTSESVAKQMLEIYKTLR